MNKINQNLSEISAETLVNYLYPELEELWNVENSGTFYRNYNRDVLSYDEETKEIQVARDGFLKLLPQGMLFRDNTLKKGERNKNIREQNRKMRLLHDFFHPFDTYAFRTRLAIEREISELLSNKLNYLLKTYFRFDMEAEQNPYVREVAALLPFIRTLRGDLHLVSKILSALFECEVRMKKVRYSQTNNMRNWIPSVQYELIIENLTSEEYIQKSEDLAGLTAFIQEWFIPFDIKCTINIKWHGEIPETSEALVLDYNAELNK